MAFVRNPRTPVIAGRVDGRRSRGRQRLLYTKQLAKHAGKNAMGLTQLAENREVFHDVTVDVID